MIRSNRFLVVLLFVALGVAVGLLGCDSDSGGNGGSGGSDGGVLRILVTNDDGIGAPGIDAIIEALRADPNNELIVCAPLEEQSGRGDNTIETNPAACPGTGEATPSSTASGYSEAVWAVDGCPADAVLYALSNLYPDAPPDVVLSGINKGQNVGMVNGFLLSQISGTVGAAKAAACSGVPAMAASQGNPELGETLDFPAGAAAVLEWLEANRAALIAGEVSVENITSINIPSCAGDSEIRGTLEVPLATENPNDEYSLGGPQDCASTSTDVPNDVKAFFNGYTTVTPVPRNSNMTCDKLSGGTPTQ